MLLNVLLLSSLVLSLVHCQDSTVTMDVTFRQSTVTCRLANQQEGFYADSDCTVFLYINSKMKSYERGKTVSFKYKKLLRATARCDGQCENKVFKNNSLRSKDLVINEGIFYGLCAAGVGVFLLIVGLAVFGLCYRKRHYRKLDGEENGAVELEVDLEEDVEMERVRKKEKELEEYDSPPAMARQPSAPQMELQAELAAEMKRKQLEQNLEDDDQDEEEDTSGEESEDNNLSYGLGYNPNRYNYSEMTSEI